MSPSSLVAPFLYDEQHHHHHQADLMAFSLDDPSSSAAFDRTSSFSPLSIPEQHVTHHHSEPSPSPFGALPSESPGDERLGADDGSQPGAQGDALAGLDLDEEMRKFIDSLPITSAEDHPTFLDNGNQGGMFQEDTGASLLAGSPPNALSQPLFQPHEAQPLLSAASFPPPYPPSFEPEQDHHQTSSNFQPSRAGQSAALDQIRYMQQLQVHQTQYMQKQIDFLTQAQTGSAAGPQSVHSYQPQRQQQLQQYASILASSFPLSQSQNHSFSDHILQAGLPTPAQSTELFPSSHHGVVSPMYLPMNGAGAYRDSVEIDASGNLILTPLISPAISSYNTPASAFQPNMAPSNSHPSDCFSPLTSPALGPIQQYSSSSFHHQYPPSMSPHLLAQGQAPSQQHQFQQPYGASSSSNPSSYSNSPNEHLQHPTSPAIVASHFGTQGGPTTRVRGRASRGGVGAQSSLGPEAKAPRSRPSPLIKPSNGPPSSRRSQPGQKRTSSSSAIITHSPLIHPTRTEDTTTSIISPTEQQLTSMFQSFTPSVSNVPFNLDGSLSSSSSPSPVDLDRVQMPPPPLPQRSTSSSSSHSLGHHQAPALAPQTPATLLNLHRPTSNSNRTLSSSTFNNNCAPINPSPLTSPYIGPTQNEAFYNALAGPSNQHQHEQIGGQLVEGSGSNDTERAWAEPGNRSRKASISILSVEGNGNGTSSSKGKSANGIAGSIVQGSGMTTRVPRTILTGDNPLRPKSKTTSKPGLASSSNPCSTTRSAPLPTPSIKTSHKLAEQKRRDSLKAGFDDLRLLLPIISISSIDPDTGLPIPGALKPRLPSKSPLAGPEDNPNRGVSKVALLRCSNERLKVLEGRVARRDWCLEKLRGEVGRLRGLLGEEREEMEGEEWLWADVDEVEQDEDEAESTEGSREEAATTKAEKKSGRTGPTRAASTRRKTSMAADDDGDYRPEGEEEDERMDVS